MDLSKYLTIEDFENAAREHLPKMTFDYFASGADAERARSKDREALDAYELWYRVFRDVSNVDTTANIVGVESSGPIAIAPCAYHKLAHPDGELASSRAASDAGFVFTLSTLSTKSIEEVAAASKGPKWFQLYVHKDRAVTRELVARAHSAGFKALVVTADVPVLGRRLPDLRNGFSLPEGVTMANFPNLSFKGGGVGDEYSFLSWIAAHHDASLTWKDLEWLGALSDLPVIVKGIVHPDDATQAAESGVRGVIVSNHGGRQLDSAPAPIHALPAVVDAVGHRVDVLVDGGIRWGTDVVKAVGLGAKAVMLGRPMLWALAAEGEAGVRHMLKTLSDELRRAMALSGCPDLASTRQGLVRKSR